MVKFSTRLFNSLLFVLQTSNEGNGKPSEHSAVEQKSDTPTSSDVGRTENGGKAEVHKTEES